jgi:hypothetical protein
MDTSDIILVSNHQIDGQRQALKGKNRHDKVLTDKYRVMNLSKYDVFLPKNTTMSSAAYNSIIQSSKKHQRKEDGKGKHHKKDY